MIGIPQLDKLDTDTMIDILENTTKILVRDPRKIQTTVLDMPPEPTRIEADMLDDATVKTLLKMEIETRAGFAYLTERIQDSD